MRALASLLFSLVLPPVLLLPACSSQSVAGCGRCADSCEREERAVSEDETLGWRSEGTAGAGGVAGATVADFIATIEGQHSMDARYIYDESLPPTDITVSLESLGDPILSDFEDEEDCGEDGVGFSALVGFATVDGRFAESAEGQAWLTKSGDWSFRFEMDSADLKGDFDPSEIEDLDDGDYLMRFHASYQEGKFHGQVSLDGPSRDHGDGVSSSSKYTVLRIPAVEE